MMQFLKTFHADTDGAVTVDWVVLTAAIVTMSLVVLTAIKGAAMDRTDNITTTIAATEAPATE